MVDLGYSGLFILIKGAVGMRIRSLRVEVGAGMWGHASGRHMGLCSGLLERYYLSIFVT